MNQSDIYNKPAHSAKANIDHINTGRNLSGNCNGNPGIKNIVLIKQGLLSSRSKKRRRKQIRLWKKNVV
jgi:hypothetical protein